MTANLPNTMTRSARVLAVLMLATLLACGSPNPHLRKAQELIAEIERDHGAGEPDYSDFRYTEVLAELAQVESSDHDFWTAREWMQKIQTGREALLATAKEAAASATETADRNGSDGSAADDSAPRAEGGAQAAAEQEPRVELEPHDGSEPSDLKLLGFQVRRDDTGVFARGYVWNVSRRKFRIKATVTALAADGAELATSTALTPGEWVWPNDRESFTAIVGAWDPTQVDVAPAEPSAAGESGLSPFPFAPKDCARLRLSFSTIDDKPLTWVDERPQWQRGGPAAKAGG